VFFGEGVSIDHKKAFSFYSKAAAEDVRAAYFMLFLMYLTGTGVEVDLKHAFSYGEKALVVEKDSKTLRLFLGGCMRDYSS
jgi:TPR repeat protein